MQSQEPKFDPCQGKCRALLFTTLAVLLGVSLLLTSSKRLTRSSVARPQQLPLLQTLLLQQPLDPQAGSCAKTFASNATTAELLAPDEAFTRSEEYLAMERHVKAKFDFEALRKDFTQKGYIVFKPDIGEEVMRGAEDFTRQCMERCGGGGNSTPPADCRDFHQDRFVDMPGVKGVAMSYDIRAMLAVLHGHEPYPFQTLNYPQSSLARTHSDYVHFAAHPLPLMSAAWVALMDIHPDAGPVFYFEGTHRMSPYNMQDFGLDDRTKHHLNYAKYQDIMTAAMRRLGYQKFEAVIPRGWCLVWSANLVHGGPPAKVPGMARLSQVTHYFFRRSNYNWAPVASDVEAGGVTYYDEEAVARKWGDEGTAEERRKLSKFKIGPCDLMTRGKPGVPGPCDSMHRLPKVLSEIFEHKSESGNDQVM